MRRHPILLTTLAALAAAAVTARAQDAPRRDRDRERGTFSFIISGDSGEMRMFDSRRGRIGISVNLVPDARRDSVGALIEEVVARSPAERAGLRAGDLVVRWNGVRLAEGEGDGLRSRPGQRLINLAQRLEPGDTVRLEVRRDGRSQAFAVVADSADMDRIVERIRIPMMGLRELGPGPGGAMFPPGEPRLRVMAFGAAALSDIELVAVSPALAQGLGIAEGILVVDAGRDSALGLRAGDVILAIGGRRPTSPAHAMRILSTYEPEETIQFDVMRQRRRQSVSGRMPAARRGEWRIRPNSFEMPLPGLPFEFRDLLRGFQDDGPRIRIERPEDLPGESRPRTRVMQRIGAET